MMKNVPKIILAIALLVANFAAGAQPSKNWDQEKIIGRRYRLPEIYRGSPYFIPSWQKGTVTFTTGEQVSDILLKHDAVHDQLIYINELYHIMVQIEKSSVASFDLKDDGTEYHFEQHYFDGLIKGNRYFQVFHKGYVNFYGYRHAELLNCSVYKNAAGNTKNMEYQQGDHYFLYKKGAGYKKIGLRKKSLLRFFSRTQRKRVKQLMHTNHVHFKTPEEFARALSILETNGIELNF